MSERTKDILLILLIIAVGAFVYWRSVQYNAGLGL